MAVLSVLSSSVALVLALLASVTTGQEAIPIWNKNTDSYRGRALMPEHWLRTGDFLMSDNCLFQFILEADGGLRLYKNVSGQRVKLWSADTSGSTAHRELWYQKDGNIVLYEYSGTAPNLSRRSVWSSVSYEDDEFPTALIMQNDGNLVSYMDDVDGDSSKANWHTGTWDENIGNKQACFACSTVSIKDWKIIGEPRDQPDNANRIFKTVDNCGLPATTIPIQITHSTETRSTEEYTFTKSFKETFSNTISGSWSFSSSAGIAIEGVGEAGASKTTTIDASRQWSNEKISSEGQKYTSMTSKFDSMELSFNMYIPANKKVTRSLTEIWGRSDVDWEGTAVCIDDKGDIIEEQPITGSFKSSRFVDIEIGCDMCDEYYTPEMTGCRVPADDGARRLLAASNDGEPQTNDEPLHF